MTSTPTTNPTSATTFPSTLGWLAAAWIDQRLARLTFGHPSPQAAWFALNLAIEPCEPTPAEASLLGRLQAFLAGDRPDDFLDVELYLDDLTQFQRDVLRACRRIPPGDTISYGALADVVGRPGAARAVGRVMATNRFPLISPCHRVVAADGSMRGFSAPEGKKMKQRLLALESTSRREHTPTYCRAT